MNNPPSTRSQPESETNTVFYEACQPPSALTIAGSDSGGGAGIQADLRTFAALKVWGTSAITAITAQNPDSITAVEPVAAHLIKEQVEQIYRFFSPAALKTGLLPNEKAVAAVGGFLGKRPEIKAVVDPVMVATSGTVFLDAPTIALMKKELLPQALLITPNLDEVAALLGWRPDNREDMVKAAYEILQAYGQAVLIKGGHLSEEGLVDVLLEKEGTVSLFEARRIPTINTHGSGCIFSAAITAFLALGFDLKRAVSQAHGYLQERMRNPVSLGQGVFIGHGQ